MVDYEYADLIDNQDKIRTLIDPTSSYALAAAYALGRAQDDEIIAAASGTAFTGETGSTSTALPGGQAITEGGTDGLTIAKLRNAKEIFDSASVDPSIPRYIVVGPKQISDLLGTTQVTLDPRASHLTITSWIVAFLGILAIVMSDPLASEEAS